MKESFVFHFEYIEDIPEELQAQYAMYVINYARYGEEPVLEDWRDKKIWNRIRSRMDDDTERYDRKCRNLRQNKNQDQNELLQEIVEEDEPKSEMPAYTNEVQEAKPKVQRFQKPTPEEVQQYCDERNNGISGQNFWDFYESKDWKIGTVKMKNWKAAVRTWEQRRHSEANNKRWNGTMTRDLPEDRNLL